MSQLATSRLKTYEISVEVDTALISPNRRNVYPVDRLTVSNIRININQYELIYAIGTIQTRRFNPSNRQKFTDFSDLIEKIKDESEFKIKLSEIRQLRGSEVLKDISEDFGVGIAVIISDNLYTIDRSTLTRITVYGTRPDFRCVTTNDDLLVVESKGYTNYYSLQNEMQNAARQKRAIAADIHAISGTLIKENSITCNWYKDPPSSGGDYDMEKMKKVYKAKHYASVLSFIGQSELSKYFSYMGKKILNSNDLDLINKKEDLFLKIKNDYIALLINGINYYGTIEEIDEKKYQFLGVDETLLYFDGFLQFMDHEKDQTYSIQENFFYIYRDGICVGEITELEPFKYQLAGKTIRNYQERTTITDIDTMNPISFEKYIEYIFKSNGFEIKSSEDKSNFGCDFLVTKNNLEFCIQIKHFTDKKKIRENKVNFNKNHLNYNQISIFITNAEANNDFDNRNIIIIDRTLLKSLIRNKKRLSEILSLEEQEYNS